MGDLSHPDLLGVPVLVLDANVDDSDENIHAGFVRQIEAKLCEIRGTVPTTREEPAVSIIQPQHAEFFPMASLTLDDDATAGIAGPSPITCDATLTPPRKTGQTTSRTLLTPSPSAHLLDA
jgi:hypothetical protein